MKSMGALEMGLAEEELQPLVSAWRDSNPSITEFWWAVDRAVKECIKKRVPTETHGIRFDYQSGMLFITLFSGRRLAYVKPRIGENRLAGNPSLTWAWAARRNGSAGKLRSQVCGKHCAGGQPGYFCYAMRTLRTAALSHTSMMRSSLRRTGGCPLLPYVNRWAGRRPGQRACCSGGWLRMFVLPEGLGRGCMMERLRIEYGRDTWS